MTKNLQMKFFKFQYKFKAKKLREKLENYEKLNCLKFEFNLMKKIVKEIYK